MAKVSRVNIAITGDSKGLAQATDAATRELRRLEAASERSRARLQAMRGTTNQAAEGLAKLGVQSRALQGVGGLMALGGLGGAGLALGGIGAAAAGAAAVVAGIQDAPNQRRRALDALRQSRADGIDIRTLGFTRTTAEAIASGRQDVSVAEQIGISEAFSQGIATGGGKSTAEFIINELPKMLAMNIGARMAGQSNEQAMRMAMEAGSEMTPMRTAVLAGLSGFAGGSLFEQVSGTMSELSKWWSK